MKGRAFLEKGSVACRLVGWKRLETNHGVNEMPEAPSASDSECEEEPRLRAFLSYSHADEILLDELRKHLSQLRRSNIIDSWHDRRINPGSEWGDEIVDRIERADLILLLISPDFLASDFCHIEMNRAIEQHARQRARVVPVILRPVDWSDTPVSKLQALPTDARPVTTWPDRDLAMLDVASGIRKVCCEIIRERL